MNQLINILINILTLQLVKETYVKLFINDQRKSSKNVIDLLQVDPEKKCTVNRKFNLVRQ